MNSSRPFGRTRLVNHDSNPCWFKLCIPFMNDTGLYDSIENSSKGFAGLWESLE